MAKKPNPFNPFGDDASAQQLGENVRASAQQIWQAGLGAFAKAQEEGSKAFDTLVKEGVGMQRKAQSAAEEKFSEAASKMSSMAGDLGSRAAGQWDKLEGIFETRVAKALHNLGVPSAVEVAALRAQVEALTRNVELLEAKAKRPAATRRPSTKTAPAASPAIARRNTRARPTKKAE
jgi:poly(hydroxyalkanoate) granule-associated protein